MYSNTLHTELQVRFQYKTVHKITAATNKYRDFIDSCWRCGYKIQYIQYYILYTVAFLLDIGSSSWFCSLDFQLHLFFSFSPTLFSVVDLTVVSSYKNLISLLETSKPGGKMGIKSQIHVFITLQTKPESQLVSEKKKNQAL